MTLAERIAATVRDVDAIPRWRVGLYAFLAGAGLTVALACVAVGRGLVTPPVEREVETRIVTRERVVTRIAKRVDTARDTKATAKLLPLPDGGVLLAYDFDTRLRRSANETSASDTMRTSDTAQRVQERPVLPSWSVGLLVGGQFAGKPALSIPNAPGLVLGVEAGYRVPLPLPPRYSLWVEAWGTTSGAAGGGLRGEF